MTGRVMVGLLAALLCTPVAAMAQVRPVVPAAVVPAPVPIVLPRAPAALNAAGSTLSSALLAIWQAQRVDPQAAQTASFAYAAAVQQYRSGNLAAARLSALQAVAIAGAAQVRQIAPPEPQPLTITAAPAQLPGTAGGLYGADAPAIDADTFVVLAHAAVDRCAARRDPATAAARADQLQAQRDFAARNWEATRHDAKAAIDLCAKAQP